MAVSAIPDINIIQKMYDLSNIIALIKSGKVKPLTQSKLGPSTEMRFLPSWLGPGIAKFFERVVYHWGISQEDFDAVQNGSYNPFTIKIPTVFPQDVYAGVSATANPPTPPFVVEEDKPKEEDPQTTVPMCYGQYDKDNEECTVECTRDGFGEGCKNTLEEKLIKRKAARRLVVK